GGRPGRRAVRGLAPPPRRLPPGLTSMSVADPIAAPPAVRPRAPGLPLAAGFAGLAAGAAVLAGGFPIGFSIATVFLFAGPHNWLEARYVLGRLPARVGKLRGFFLLSAAGIV